MPSGYSFSTFFFDPSEFIGYDCAVKLELASIKELEHIHTAYRARIILHDRDELLFCLADLVLDFYGITDIFICDFDAEFFLNIGLESEALSLIKLESLFTLGVRKIHYEYILELSHKLIHLLLSVAGVLTYYDVAEVEERALVVLSESIAGLDKRAEVCRQILFS